MGIVGSEISCPELEEIFERLRANCPRLRFLAIQTDSGMSPSIGSRWDAQSLPVGIRIGGEFSLRCFPP